MVPAQLVFAHRLEGAPLQRLNSCSYPPCGPRASSFGYGGGEPSKADYDRAMAFTVAPEPRIIIFHDSEVVDGVACSLALAHYVLRQRRELVREARVLVLGCGGGGLAGIAASRAGACRVHLTDGSAAALELARRGVAASGVGENTVVSRLGFGQVVEDEYDVCLALDVILADDAIDNLVRTLTSVLCDAAHQPMAVVAWKRRAFQPSLERKAMDELRAHFDLSVMADLPCLPRGVLKPVKFPAHAVVDPNLANGDNLVFLRVEAKAHAGQKRARFQGDEGRPLRRHASLP